MKGLRVLELSEALTVDSADLLAVCAILKIKATSRLSMLSFDECKEILISPLPDVMRVSDLLYTGLLWIRNRESV